MYKRLNQVWWIVRTLIMIAVALGCFSLADSRFSRVLVSLLILIYLQGLATGSIFMRATFQQIADIMKELRTVRHLLGDGSIDTEDNSMNDKIMARLADSPVQEVVHLIGSSIIYLIVLWNLLKAVVGF